MLRAIGNRLNHRAAAWLRRRSPRQPGPIVIHRRIIYILPTRGGLYYGVAVFAMLLGALNYANSLGFVLTFLLGGIGLVGMHHTHRNLLGLRISAQPPEGAFAGASAGFGLTLGNPGRTARFSVALSDGGGTDAGTVDLPAQSEAQLALPVPATRRGRLALPPVRIETIFPMGLFRAWTWVQPEAACVVYPAPRGNLPLPAPRSADETTGDATAETGCEDFAGLRRYERGDPARLIHWKAYPRTGELMTRQFHDPREQGLWLDWQALAPLAAEARLSQLTRWVLDADTAGLAFGLSLPTTTLAPNDNAGHRARCLEQLALFDA